MSEYIYVLDIIEELRNEPGSNGKKEIMRKYRKRDDFLKTLLFTYDETKVFGIKQIPCIQESEVKEYIENHSDDEGNFNYLPLIRAIIDMEEILINQKIRGHAAQNFIKELLMNTTEKDQEVIKLIINKDLRCGINKKTVKNVFPDLIKEIPYMGAVPFDEKKVRKIIDQEDIVFVQKKEDGEFGFCVINNLSADKDKILINFISRRNKIIQLPDIFLDKIKEIIKQKLHEIPQSIKNKDQIILNGELLINGISRHKANGIFKRLSEYLIKVEELSEMNEPDEDDKEGVKKYNKLVKLINKSKEALENSSQMTLDELSDNIMYVVWDYNDENQGDVYLNRFMDLSYFIDGNTVKRVKTTLLIDSDSSDVLSEDKTLKLTDNETSLMFISKDKFYKEIYDFYMDEIDNGYEGAIVKGGNSLWKEGKPVYQVKIKDEIEFELKIVQILPGDKGKKNENTLGRVLAESEDGLFSTKISGFDDELRDIIWENKQEYLGKIVTVMVNFISKAKDKDTWSAGHPRIIKFRDDKDKADTLEEILKIAGINQDS